MAAPALTPYDGPSPDDVAMQRKLAMSLMQQGTSAEPVGHWTQALARVLQGGVGGMYQDTARQGERQGTQGIVDMLQGQQNPTPVQLLSNPWTREAGMKTLVLSRPAIMPSDQEISICRGLFGVPHEVEQVAGDVSVTMRWPSC